MSCGGIRFYRSEPEKVQAHDAILHLLNRKVGEDYLPVEPFEATIEDWNGIPLIFAPKHIDFSCSLPAQEDTNLQAYLAAVEGTIVGELSESRIEQAGRPKLMARFNFGEETASRLFEAGLIDESTYQASIDAIPVCQQLVDEGKLSLSSAFCAPDDGNGSITGKVRPNHVLLFEETEKSQPKDKSAVILNQMEADMEKFENAGKVISSGNRVKFKSALDSLWNLFKEMAGGVDPEQKEHQTESESMEERRRLIQRAVTDRFGRAGEGMEKWGAWILLTFESSVIFRGTDERLYEVSYAVEGDTVNLGEPVEVEVSYTKKETNMAEPEGVPATPDPREEQIEALKRENAEMQAKIAASDQAAKDAAWVQLKNKLPPGMVHGEKEQETRKLFESDPVAFTNQLLDLKKGEATLEEGEQHTNQGEGAEDTLTIVRELHEASGRGRR